MSRRLISSRCRKILLLAVIVFPLGTAGCDSSVKEPMGTLSGTVKSQGEICGNCRIALHSEKGSKGLTVGDSGTFEFKEVPFGDYKVTVYQKPTNDAVEVFDKRIPEKYRQMRTSGLAVSIPSAEPVTLDVDMD